ncbi:MAG: ADP-forming succinate--CoA ligase subunit beta [Candidatus Omnitrophota bacterium]|nr:ADP-forming succinate--CoA ligase subunit beta [Candidatus Omnitrophota bacterium]
MNIHEYQAKEIFETYSIPTNRRRVASSAEEAYKAARELQDDKHIYSVKAQVHAGARGKGGGIKIIKTPEEVRDAAQALLGTQLVTPQTGPEGKPVNEVLIEATSDIRKEYYASVVLDRAVVKPCLIVSEVGGMEIEEVASNEPDKILKAHFSLETGLSSEKARQYADRLVRDPKLAEQFAKIFQAMAILFVDLDCSLLEINPLAVMENDEVIAIDAKINFDDNALFLHPEITKLRDTRQEDPREIEAKAHDLSYVGLKGNIGCIVNGAGLAMATMDIIKYAGGQPANFLDVGGGADAKKVAAAFKIILTDPNVKAILVNIFGGIMRCDIVAEGILAAVGELEKEGKSPLEDIPLIVRLEGTNVKEGKKILEESNLELTAVSSFEEAAEKVTAVL